MLIMKINFLKYLSLFNLSINNYFSMEKDVVEIENIFNLSLKINSFYLL